MHIPLTIKIMYEPEATDAPFVAYLPEFDLSSCGKTEAEARANVHEALAGVIEVLKDDGSLEEFLAPCCYS